MVSYQGPGGRSGTIVLPVARKASDFIVEFKPLPGGVSAAAVKDLRRKRFAAFRRDLAALQGRTKAAAVTSVAAPVVRFEYQTVFYGAAVSSLTPAAVERIRALPYVADVHEDVRVEAMQETGPAAVHDAAARVGASTLPTRGKGIVVAVLDTGIDYNHSALGGGLGAGFKVIGGWDFVNGDADPMDDHGHGTHVAGIIAADSAELLGVAPEASLIAYKVLDNTGSGATSRVIAAIERGTDPNGDGNTSDHIDVINLSLGGPSLAGDPLALAADVASAAGVVVCAAAGNNGNGAARISSPGIAREALTVGASDDAGVIAPFSSQGPARGSRHYFKPDVTAPGVAIVSAKLGGGIIPYSGTSMATPHVAGASALLLALHPDWSPARIKSALAATALPVSGKRWAAGAGRIDAARAAAANLYLGDSGVSFGELVVQEGTWTERYRLRVSNPQARPETLRVVLGEMPQGVTVTAGASEIQIPAGGSYDLGLVMTADAANVPFTPDAAVHTELQLIGTGETLKVPLIALRAVRLVVKTDMDFRGVFAIGGGGFDEFRRIELVDENYGAAELLTAGGRVADIVMTGVDGDYIDERTWVARRLYLGVKENFTFGSEESIYFLKETPARHFVANALDEHGTPLAERERPTDWEHFVTSWIALDNTADEEEPWRFNYSDSSSDTLELFVASTGPRFQAGMHQAYIDRANDRLYLVNHPPIVSTTPAQTLTSTAADYSKAHVAMNYSGPGPAVYSTCLYVGAKTGGVSYGCTETKHASRRRVFEVFGSRVPDPEHHSYTFFLKAGTVEGARLRPGPGGIALTTTNDVKPNDLVIPNGGTAEVGRGLVSPRTLRRGNTPAYLGPWNESLFGAGSGAHYTLHDSAGKLVSAGLRLETPRPLPARHRYVLTTYALRAAESPSTGVYEVWTGSNEADLDAPTLTSLAVVDESGGATGELFHGSSATLRFSVADYDFRSTDPELSFRTQPLRGDLTRAFYRVSGTAEWKPLPLTTTAIEEGPFIDRFRHHAGHLYEASLRDLTTRYNNVRFDLRFEYEDASGNRASWTQSPAISVGTPTVVPPRRRTARH